VLGWFADTSRLAWGLSYWNARKAWFQFCRGRTPCPFQVPSDSGRAYETGCEAALSWHRQTRFQRVCPLLVETRDGLRCSVNAADVRPFGGQFGKYYGGALLALYVAGVIGVFSFLRTIGYPVSIPPVALPPLWHKVGQARGWFFVEQANQAFAAGKRPEGLLYLASAYDFGPASNYEAGLTLSKIAQARQPARSDDMFQRLLRDHPEYRAATTEGWFLALLPRSDLPRIISLARSEVLTNREDAHVWIRALFFATRRTQDDAPLRALLENPPPEAAVWHPLLEVELLLRGGRKAEAQAAILRPWPATAPAYSLYYRVSKLIEMGAILRAVDLLAQYPQTLDSQDAAALRLDALASHRATANLNRPVEDLLAGRLDASTVRILFAHLIRYPDEVIFGRLWERIERIGLPMDTDYVGSWFSLLATAGAVGDTARLHQITGRLKQSATTPFIALGMVESFFNVEMADRPVTNLLPLLPLPLEVTYALLERYPPPRPRVTVSIPRP
jgi:hypothetical protein